MVVGLTVLLACQLAGEVVVRVLGLPVPGPVVGMLVLLLVLRVRRPGPGSGLVRAPRALLRHLSLLYVPAGVGVIVFLPLLGREAVPVVGGLVVSWAAGLLVTAGVAALLLRLTGAPKVLR